jgi:hexosaminidase
MNSRDLAISNIVPAPAHSASTDEAFIVSPDTTVYGESEDVRHIAEYLVDIIYRATNYELSIIDELPEEPSNIIQLGLADTPDMTKSEEYQLEVTAETVRLTASEPAGVFNGVQTLRQFLLPLTEDEMSEAFCWEFPGGMITDYPRFPYRGAHLDVARHFFSVDEIKQIIDYLAQYKINHLHLHLTDDQGWRIEIESWPKLTEIGGSTEVGGGPGGYYTQAEYTDLVEYARDRFITVVPEVDMPGHTNAALASYAELNCDDEQEDLYTGTDVGFSSLCVNKDVTYEFVDDVIRELAELTPGPYIHIGGDEADPLSAEEYDKFMDRVIPIVENYDKRPIGWHQVLQADPPESTVAQYWYPGREAPEVAEAAQEGHEIIMSPASHAYLDMKYNEDTNIGLSWAGTTSLRGTYEWEPGNFVEGVDESSIKGVETALWSETVDSLDDAEFMLFPRLPAVAELGWSSKSKTSWEDFRRPIATHIRRWDLMDINYFASPDVAKPSVS